MNKTIIKIPTGIGYISDWKEYSLPKNHVIVDKGVTGCGYTEYCLTNENNVILCSPRKLLLENKMAQHAKAGNINVLYLENTIENFTDSLSLSDRITNHITRCLIHHLPVKFMITYDSLHYIIDYLRERGHLGKFRVIVDEFQSIFLDSYFKSDIELDFVKVLQDCPNVLYLSATPMLDKYLCRLPEFKDLDFHYLDWSETGFVEKIVIERKKVSSLISECNFIIKSYREGKFPKTVDYSTRKIVRSTEAVFYFNSLSDICKILKSNHLTPKEARILCADTNENKKKLRALGFEIGTVPLKGESNSMFTFCTSAVYMGVDFYSKCAKSFVFADPNISSLALDISLDLPQIAGRQRDRDNPFKNEIVMFYRSKRKGETEVTLEEFNRAQGERRKVTETLLSLYKRITDEEQKALMLKLKDGITQSNYSKDFVAISRLSNEPVWNYLVEISTERAWEVSQKEYQDCINIARAFREAGLDDTVYRDQYDDLIDSFLQDYFNKTNLFPEKLKLYCEFLDSNDPDPYLIERLDSKIQSKEYSKYYILFGTKGCSSKKFRKTNLDIGLVDKEISDRDLKQQIYSTFSKGKAYPISLLKSELAKIYKDLGISKKAKATDLKDYFSLNKTRVTVLDDLTGEKIVKDGFRLN